MINPYLDVDTESTKSQPNISGNPYLPSTSTAPSVNPYLPQANPYLPSQGGDVGGYTGPEGGRTPLNILAAMPGTLEGVIKTGFHFALATPYATAKAGLSSLINFELDRFPDVFYNTLRNAEDFSVLGLKPFGVQTEAGERFQYKFHEWISPIINHFDNQAERAFAATNNPAVATGIRTVGELVGLLVPIFGIKGAVSLSKTVAHKIPAKPINIPGTETGLPLGRGYYEDPRNLVTFKEFSNEYAKILPAGERYNEQTAKDMYAEFNRKTREGEKDAEPVIEQNVEIVREEAAREIRSSVEETMDPGTFLSAFDQLINPRTNKPYSDAVIKKKFGKFVDMFPMLYHEPGKYKKPVAKEYRFKTARTHQEMIEKNQAIKDMNRIIAQRKREGRTLDPAITQEMAVKILESGKKAVYSENSKKIYSDTRKGIGEAEAKAIGKGETEYSHGISTRGVISKGTKFFSDYEVYQLMEKAQTNKIPLESEFAKRLKIEKSIIKEPDLAPESIKGMTSGRYEAKMLEDEAILDIAKDIAKGPKEVKTLSPKELEGTPAEKAIFDFTQRMWEKEGGWRGKAKALGGKIGPDNGGDLLASIAHEAGPRATPIKYRGMSRKNQSLFSIILDGSMSKSMSLLADWRQVSPTFAKILDSIAPPDIHLTLYDTKGAARRPRSAESFHQEKATKSGDFITGTKEGQGFDGLNTIFYDLKPTWFPGVQQLIRHRGKILSNENNLKMIGAIRGNRPMPSGILGEKTKKMQILFREADKYIKEVFPDHESLGNYFPQSWNQPYIRRNMDQWTRDLVDFLETEKVQKELTDKFGKIKDVLELADEVTMNILGEGKALGSNRVDAVMRELKNMANKDTTEIKALSKRASGVDHSRILKDVPLDIFEKYMKNDAYEGAQFYIEEMVSRVEWARRFGENNELLYKGLIDGIKEANAKGVDIEAFRVERALRLAEAMQGVYKMGGNRSWVNFQRWWTNILNAVLLPLATVASLPEAALPLYNGGIKAYAKAIPKEVFGTATLLVGKAIKKDFKLFGTDKTRSMIIAEQIRKAGDVATMERLNALFQGDSSVLGNVVFRANLLHYWTKWMNHLAVGTYDAMVKDYFKAKSTGKKTGMVKSEEVRMERLMEYYGLPTAEGIAWVRRGSKIEGDPGYTKADRAFFEKLKRGAHLFAEESVLTPNPSILPLWHSNPNLAWLRHLKTFPTLIGNKVMAKWGRDVYKGFRDQNMPVSGGRAGMYAIGTGMTLLLIADFSNQITDYLRYGEKGNPLYKQRYKNMSEIEMRLIRAVERAGLFGMGNFVFDSMFHSYTSAFGVFMGPTFTKGDAIFKALGEGIFKHNGNGLAREFVKMTPILNINKPVRDEAIRTLQDFIRDNTFMDEGKAGWRAMPR